MEGLVIIVPNEEKAKEVYERTGHMENIINFYLIETEEWRYFIRTGGLYHQDKEFVYLNETYDIYKQSEKDAYPPLDRIDGYILNEYKVPVKEYFQD